VSNITVFDCAIIIYLIIKSRYVIYVWNFSRIFILLPFLVTCKISTMSFMGELECPLSVRCCANFYFPFLYVKSRKWSWNLVWNALPVCPIYFLWQSWHVSW